MDGLTTTDFWLALAVVLVWLATTRVMMRAHWFAEV